MTPRFELRRLLQAYRYLPELYRVVYRVRNWEYVLPAYLGLRAFDRSLPFETRTGARLELASVSDLVTAWVVFVRDEYSVPGNTTSILDIGANIGAYTLFAAQSNPTARIVAVEPAPNTFGLLQKNIAANSLRKHVTALNTAVAGETGTREFFLASESAFSGFWKRDEPEMFERLVETDTTTLTDLLRQYFPSGCDVLKMDCEGAEHEALLATPVEVLAGVKRLSMEYHPVAPIQPLFDHLATAGFEILSDSRVAENHGTVNMVNRRVA